MESQENKSDSRGLVSRMLRVPESHDERVGASALGIGSLVSSAAILLVRGISGMAIPGFLLAGFLGLVSYHVVKRYPSWKDAGYFIAGASALVAVNAIPGLRGIGSFLLGSAAFLSAAFGVWKLGSVLVGIYRNPAGKNGSDREL